MNRRPQQSREDYDAFSSRDLAHFKVSSPDTRFFDKKKRRPLRVFVIWFFLLAVLAVLLINFIVDHFVFIYTETIPVKGLNESFEGYTILHISDLKGQTFGENQALFSLLLRDKDYDVVLLTGDMISSRGNAQPFYSLIEMLRELAPSVPIYYIAGDSDPSPTSMTYASGGSPFAPWVLGAKQRGAIMLSAPQSVERDGQTLWLTTLAQLNLDIDTMQPQFELSYLNAMESGDDNEIELAKYNLSWLESTRNAREVMKEEDVYIALTHVPPTQNDLNASSFSRVDLLLCGHYLGGLMRLPWIGPIFIPSQTLPLYGLFPGEQMYTALSREGSTWVYTSTGLGGSDPLYPAFFFRLFNPPSVTLLTLTTSSL